MPAKKNAWLRKRPPPRPRGKFVIPKPAEIKTEPAKMIVQGQEVDSKEEWYVALALDKMEMEYEYQYEVRGGKRVRGGQVLDFVVWTPGRPTALDVRGLYWHTGRREDELSLKIAVQAKGYDLVVIWTYEIPNVAAALTVLRARLRHG